MKKGSYSKFALMMLSSFVAMYFLMFINMEQFDHFSVTLTRIYMAACMVAVMALIMMLFMQSMYKNKKLNNIIKILSIVSFFALLFLLRSQTAISDVQWMRGMIPHHSSAIMTSSAAHLEDPEVKKLAQDIIDAQKREIAQMQEMIARLEAAN